MTNRIFLILVGCLFISALSAQTRTATPPKDAALYIDADDDDHDFGNIQFAKPVKYVVRFQNISKDTLTLTNVSVSCGCTVPEWQHGPYAPRDTFSIKITFNGYADTKFNRTLTLLFNNDIVKILRFHGVGYKKLPVTVDNSNYDTDDMDFDAMAVASPKKASRSVALLKIKDKVIFNVSHASVY